MRSRRALLVMLVPVILLLALGGYILATVNTDTTVTIGSGISGSASYQTAERLKEGLEARGFKADIVTTPQTLDLISFLADPENPVDVTFVSEGVDVTKYPSVTSLGTVALDPLIFGTMPGSHGIDTLTETRGSRIEIGPVGSVRAAFATEVLAQFGVTAKNSTFINLPADASLVDLQRAGVQVVTVRQATPRQYLLDMIATDTIRVIAVPEAKAISGMVDSAEAVDVPYGAFQVSPPIPDEPLPVVAQLVTVVADQDVSPAAAYAIARELTQEFSAGDAISQPGEFPNFSDRQLPVNPYAADYYSTGQVPWEYQNLPPILADSFVSIIVVGTTILVLASIYSLFLPEAYSLWTGIIKPRSEERYISSMEAALASGRELTVTQRKRLSEILERQDSERVLRQRADTLRPQLSAPIDDETDNERDGSTGEVLGERRRQPETD